MFAFPGAAGPNGSIRLGPNCFSASFANQVGPVGPTDGWGFGDRKGYGCCFWYFMVGGEIGYRATLQRVTGLVYVIIDDKYGVEQQSQVKGCPLPAQPYHTSPKPPDLTDCSIIVPGLAGGVPGVIPLFATVPTNPDAWWEVDEADGAVAE